jgi:hypothetical protein
LLRGAQFAVSPVEAMERVIEALNQSSAEFLDAIWAQPGADVCERTGSRSAHPKVPRSDVRSIKFQPSRGGSAGVSRRSDLE